jgi:hypothetical protein
VIVEKYQNCSQSAETPIMQYKVIVENTLWRKSIFTNELVVDQYKVIVLLRVSTALKCHQAQAG